MKTLGSPVGLILIGVGVVVLSLGWTGRFQDVWNAIKGAGDAVKGGADKIDPTGDSGRACSNTGDCGNNETCQNGKCVKAPGNPPCQKDSDCPTGTTCESGTCRDTSGCAVGTRHVKMDVDGTEQCFPESCLASPEGGKCRNGYNMGILIESGSRTQICVRALCGMAGYGKTSIVSLPTGLMARRYQPNA